MLYIARLLTLNDIRHLKEEKKNFQNQETIREVDEETTHILEVENCKKV